MNNLKEQLLGINLVINNEYLDKYIELINNNLKTPKQTYKTQIHHIIPRYYFKCCNLKIDDTKQNLVNLFFKDHILAHYYLTKCSSTDYYKYSNLLALQYMLNGELNFSQDILLDIQNEYEKTRNYIREKNPMFNLDIKLRHDKIMATDEVRNKISNTMKKKAEDGQLFSDEHRKKLSSSTKGKIYIHKDNVYTTIYPNELEKYISEGWEKGDFKLSKEHIEALRKSHLGKKYSAETRKKLSDAHKGKPPSNKGIPHSQETKDKISNKLRGRKWVNNGLIQKQVPKDELQKYLDDGFKLGCLRKGVDKDE